MSNANLTDEYFEIINDLDGAVEDRRASFNYMKNSTAIVHHQVVASSFVPRLFDQQSYNAMKRTSETAHKILCKVINQYLENPEYRRVFDFDERLQEIILLPRGYDSVLPFARLDTFLNEDDYTVKFCEFNGDGSAGMNENREITSSVVTSETFGIFKQNHQVKGCDLFEPWVKRFMAIYDTFVNKVENPRVAICDYLENGVVDEFYIYAGIFEKLGFECIVEDVRRLTFDGSVLRDSKGREINAIWRRCVTNDVIEYWDDSQALIDAVRAQKVALIGSFAGHIVHDKQIFDVLYKPETHAFLTDDEVAFIKETVPLTTFLTDECVDLNDVHTNKDKWIIKPTDHYGADNVYAGCEVSQEKWDALVDEFANARAGYPFIAQHYMTPFKTKTLPPDTNIEGMPDGAVSSVPALYNNMNGLYLYDGHFQGVFSRLGPHPTISKTNDGITSATIWVDAEVESGLEL
jgi:uncharacterized circularly permuted ATP-grasp superfamily protein